VAGVALGLMTPARPLLGDRVPLDVVTGLAQASRRPARGGVAGNYEPVSPAERLLHALHPWVAFFIMPVFALANAGVALEPAALGQPVAVAIAVAWFWANRSHRSLQRGVLGLGLAKLPLA